jgi:L-tyrosine isonitrile synthase
MSFKNPPPHYQSPQPAHHQQARKQAPRKDGPADAATAVIATFNTWAFKREQPSDPSLLSRFVGAAIVRKQPIEFVLYWGKGPRQSIARPDVECLDFLQSLTQRIETVYSAGALIRLIFTDTHATLNGHSAATMDSYFGAVEVAALERRFETCRLGAIVRSHPEAAAAPPPLKRPAGTLENLTRTASRWYRGRGKPSDGAVAYYDMNMVEKRAVERQFPAAIFVTFNGSEVRELFPDALPIFYMYSLRKGFGVKPWFLDENGHAVTLPEAPASKGMSAA